MSILKRLFDKTKRKEEGLEKHIDYIKTLKQPTVHIQGIDNMTYSKIGGLPNLPDNLKWPTWKKKAQSFICQIDLSEIPENAQSLDLPKEGTFYFFNNQEQETWGFDPKDKGSWTVLFSPKSKNDISTSPMPDSLLKEFVFKEKYIQFSTIYTYPDWQDERINALELNDKQFDEYEDLYQNVYNDEPAHQMLGTPSPIQGNDMDLECQLASNGINCGDGNGYESKEAKKLSTGRNDWILLLQVDTDDDIDMMWGDSGMLYFWIRKQDIQLHDFTKCWMILQCY